MVERENIISFLKTKGPSVPNDMKRTLGGDTMIFGAMLSELSGRGSVLITKVKKGSSPFYYLPGQEQQLEKLIEFCNPKDQKTLALLKEKKVLRDQTLELFDRVSLRQVPDFAKEVNVNTANGKMMFWRYYLISEEEAINQLRNLYNKKPESKEQIKPVEAKPLVQEQTAPVTQQQPKPQLVSSHVQTNQGNESSKVQPLKAKIITSEKEFVAQPHKTTEHIPAEENQHQLSSPLPLDKTEFLIDVIKYFHKADITILSQEQIAKNREYEFVVRVPSAVGTMEMYARARNKKKLNEGDVAPALLKAKTKDLPCIFLSNGDFTKKSLQLIEKEYKGIIIKKI